LPSDDSMSAAIKTNRLTVDDGSRQALSQAEIEELKKSAAGKEIIEKILAGHAGLDEKTVFSKAKYMLRKRSKYLKRFSVLPMDIGNLRDYIFEKEPGRVLEMREETLGLVGAWSNAHVYAEGSDVDTTGDEKRVGGGRWLVVDETGGLVVGALAERMNLLHTPEDPSEEEDAEAPEHQHANDVQPQVNGASTNGDITMADAAPAQANGDPPPAQHPTKPAPEHIQHRDFPLPALTNSITILHPAVQPNISLLKHFGYDSNNPDASHPLHTHLKPLSWLQLLQPDQDPTYQEPKAVPDTELAKWKSGKRGTYFKKRRRWERCKSIVDEARDGGFEGIVIASNMDPASILPHTVPLIRGGGHVVIYSPTIEPLVRVMDLYSKERRTAYIQYRARGEDPDAEEFPVDPRMLLAPTLQTSRVREWQVLPSRTHPLMTGKGGSEGYVFTARKVIPLEGGVQAKGNYGAKRRKVALDGDAARVAPATGAGAEAQTAST